MYGFELAVAFEIISKLISIPGNGAKNLLTIWQVYQIVQVIKPVSTGISSSRIEFNLPTTMQRLI